MSGYGRYQDRVRGREPGLTAIWSNRSISPCSRSCSKIVRQSKPQT